MTTVSLQCLLFCITFIGVRTSVWVPGILEYQEQHGPSLELSPGASLELSTLALVDPMAVCGDGSPAAYYYAAPPPPADGSSAPERRIWILDLMGGGWCHDVASCEKRCPIGSDHMLCSSKKYPSKLQVGGLFQPHDDVLLGSAHKVFVTYCTSDAHMGDGTAFGRQFRGARVVTAVISDLVARLGLGAANGNQMKDLLIFGGQSAGGRGAMANLDYVAEMLGPGAATNVDVVGFLDSPLWIDMPPFPGSGFDGFGKECQDVYKSYNISRLGRECANAHATGGEAWKCIMGQYRLPHLQTPYLVVASQYDAFQLGMNGIKRTGPKTPEMLEYASDLANRTVAQMRSLRSNWRRPGQNAVFSWACYEHASSLLASGFDVHTCGAAGTTVHSALSQFLSSAHAESKALELEWLETCNGFACGSGCSQQLKGGGLDTEYATVYV